MRIGLTDYYTITKRVFVRNSETKRIRPVLTHGYALSVYGKTPKQIQDIMADMSDHRIYAQYHTLVDDAIPLPHILVIEPRSVEKLEEQFRAQNITLDENRFQQYTDWDDVLDFEEQRHPTSAQKLAAILRNKAHHYASKAAYQKQKWIKKIRSAVSK